MRRRLIRIVTRFAIAIAIILAFGGLFKLYTDSQLSVEQQNEVLIKAIPFVAVFVSIIVAFACVIVIVAIWLGGRVPVRTYRPIEMIIIAGILLGVLGLFQGWKLFAYEYGFLLLLASVVAFMIWSHFEPLPLRASKALPPLSRRAHLMGLAAALVAWIAITALLIPASKPTEPYGFGQTLWDFKTDEEKAQIRDDAEEEFRMAKVPVLALVSLLPASLVYLAVRELVPDGAKTSPAAHSQAVPPERLGASPG
ncbi:MAG: hypothetical protein KBH93_00235 [Anaerolineae bacterium]|nr:hypothetical protein [Anaerolineae bacterium]